MEIVSRDPFIVIAALSYIIAVAFVYYLVVVKGKEKKVKITKGFFNALREGLKSGSIETIDDVVDIYKGISGLGADDLDYRYGLSRRLREFLVELISKKFDETLVDEIIREWKGRISDFIKKNEAVSPYSDLPAAERNILSDISTFLEKNDTESVKRKSLELAGMIQARHDDLIKVRNVNKWTIPLSIIGLILTVIFGILALKK